MNIVRIKEVSPTFEHNKIYKYKKDMTLSFDDVQEILENNLFLNYFYFDDVEEIKDFYTDAIEEIASGMISINEGTIYLDNNDDDYAALIEEISDYLINMQEIDIEYFLNEQE